MDRDNVAMLIASKTAVAEIRTILGVSAAAFMVLAHAISSSSARIRKIQAIFTSFTSGVRIERVVPVGGFGPWVKGRVVPTSPT